jgi:hypothetical protein
MSFVDNSTDSRHAIDWYTVSLDTDRCANIHADVILRYVCTMLLGNSELNQLTIIWVDLLHSFQLIVIKLSPIAKTALIACLDIICIILCTSKLQISYIDPCSYLPRVINYLCFNLCVNLLGVGLIVLGKRVVLRIISVKYRKVFNICI